MFSTLHLKTFLQKTETIGFILALACSYLLFPVFFNALVLPVPNTGAAWMTLDASWNITLNKIHIDQRVWGQDFVLTYGPLSYLSTRIGWGVGKFDFLLFDLFVWFNFFSVFYRSYVSSANKKTTALLIVFTTVLLPVYFGSGSAIILLAFFIYWLRQSLEQPKPLFYAMQVLLLVLLFFIKFNTGLISFVFFFVMLAYKLFFTKENKLIIAAVAITPFIFIYLLATPLHVALAGYLKGGLNMVSGYNGIMYLDEHYDNETAFAITIIFLAAAVLVFKTLIEKKQALKKNMLVLLIFSLCAYILYKQAFTRADIQHILEFYNYVLLFILCLPDFHSRATHPYHNAAILALVFMAFFFSKKREDQLFRFDRRMSKADYLSGFTSFTDTSGIRLFPNNNQLRAAIKNKIGRKSVDVYPWNSHLLLENNLNYTPRPAFQSYLAYTPYLENLNLGFYNSASAPAYVLYEFEAIDGRYPLFDEPKVHAVLFKNYTCIDTLSFAGRPVLLLEKQYNGGLSFKKIREYDLPLTDVIVPQAGRYYELFVSINLRGKLESLLNHSPELKLLIKTTDGNSREYRTSKQLLASGIFSDHFFNSTLDVYARFKKDSLGLVPDVAAYSVVPANPQLFSGTLKVIEYTLR